MLSSEFFEIFKNTFSTKHIRATAYEYLEFLFHQSYYILFIKLIRFIKSWQSSLIRLHSISFIEFANFNSNGVEAVVHRCSSKQMFLKISQFTQENTCVGVSFNKVAGLMAWNFIKKDSNTGIFLLNLRNF